MIDLKIVGSLCVHPCAFAWKLNRGIRGMPQAMLAMRQFQPPAPAAPAAAGAAGAAGGGEGGKSLGGSPDAAGGSKVQGKSRGGVVQNEVRCLERNREALSPAWAAMEEQQAVQLSPKLAAVVAIVRTAMLMGEKVVVFAEEHVHLDLVVGSLCHALNWTQDEQVLRVDGSMTQAQRSDAFERFQKEVVPQAAVMVAAVKACGLGIDFTAASRVVMLDALWNPASDQQVWEGGGGGLTPISRCEGCQLWGKVRGKVQGKVPGSSQSVALRAAAAGGAHSLAAVPPSAAIFVPPPHLHSPQAISRVWRTGQQRRVHVYRLLLEGMGEMYKLRCAQAKQRLAHAHPRPPPPATPVSPTPSSAASSPCHPPPIPTHILSLSPPLLLAPITLAPPIRPPLVLAPPILTTFFLPPLLLPPPIFPPPRVDPLRAPVLAVTLIAMGSG
ncbi:unnamed protein product [Closterium sp. NIES-64]|nr:unnamed protein product [Closterium sp. NIES-64]